jgi:hypothetical protein
MTQIGQPLRILEVEPINVPIEIPSVKEPEKVPVEVER